MRTFFVVLLIFLSSAYVLLNFESSVCQQYRLQELRFSLYMHYAYGEFSIKSDLRLMIITDFTQILQGCFWVQKMEPFFFQYIESVDSKIMEASRFQRLQNSHFFLNVKIFPCNSLNDPQNYGTNNYRLESRFLYLRLLYRNFSTLDNFTMISLC